MLNGKDVLRTGRRYNKIEKTSLVPIHTRNIQITKYFSFKPRFTGVFSRDNLPRIKDGAFIINLDDKQIKETYWGLLFIDRNTAVNFDSFEAEYVPQNVLCKIKDKSITHTIFRTQHDDSVMCGFYCITFIEYIIAGKTLLDYINFIFS